MNIDRIEKSTATTRVHIDRFASDRPVSDDLIAGFAMAAARETPSSLFGWHVCRFTGDNGETVSAVVALHTD